MSTSVAVDLHCRQSSFPSIYRRPPAIHCGLVHRRLVGRRPVVVWSPVLIRRAGIDRYGYGGGVIGLLRLADLADLANLAGPGTAVARTIWPTYRRGAVPEGRTFEPGDTYLLRLPPPALPIGCAPNPPADPAVAGPDDRTERGTHDEQAHDDDEPRLEREDGADRSVARLVVADRPRHDRRGHQPRRQLGTGDDHGRGNQRAASDPAPQQQERSPPPHPEAEDGGHRREHATVMDDVRDRTDNAEIENETDEPGETSPGTAQAELRQTPGVLVHALQGPGERAR